MRSFAAAVRTMVGTSALQVLLQLPTAHIVIAVEDLLQPDTLQKLILLLLLMHELPGTHVLHLYLISECHKLGCSLMELQESL